MFRKNYIEKALDSTIVISSDEFEKQCKKVMSDYKSSFPNDCAQLELLFWMQSRNLVSIQNFCATMDEVVKDMYDHFDEVYKAPKIFVSHSTDDKPIVEKFVTMLEQGAF